MNRFAVALFLLALCFITTNFAQISADKQPFQFKGVFKDETSAVIIGLSLLFEKDGKNINSTTDENGEFEAALPAGEYKLTISRSISEDFISYIKIQENGLNPNNVEFVVKPSLKCCQTDAGAAFPKVINIPKPSYPPAARAVHATGDVLVKVKIDKEGKVTSAQAVSGHPLLRQAGVLAARQGLFEPSENFVERETDLTFIFFFYSEITKELKRYSNPYRIEVGRTPKIIVDKSGY